MKRIAIAVFAGFLGLFSQTGHAANYQDWWWNPAQSGMGVAIGHQGNTVYAAWSSYRADGSATFLTMAAPLVGSSATGSLIRTTGTPPGPSYNPAAVQSVAVGTATLTFTGDATATLAYQFDGLSGTMPLQRFTFSALPLTGIYQYSTKTTDTGCTVSARNGTSYEFGTAVVAATNGDYAIRAASVVTGGYCDYFGKYVQNGAMVSLTGSFACPLIGISGNSQFAITVTDNAFHGTATLQATVGETCHETISFAAVRQ